MTRFLVERRFHVGEKDMPEVSRRSKRLAIDHFPEITWEHSHVIVDDVGTVKTYCVYVAPSEDVVRRHAVELGLHDVEGIYEIAGDVTPDDFPLD
jgi:Nickel responsive protein SCO4226-like